MICSLLYLWHLQYCQAYNKCTTNRDGIYEELGIAPEAQAGKWYSAWALNSTLSFLTFQTKNNSQNNVCY